MFTVSLYSRVQRGIYGRTNYISSENRYWTQLLLRHSRRYQYTSPQYSEDRVAAWCRRLWGLAQSSKIDSQSTNTNSISSSSFSSSAVSSDIPIGSNLSSDVNRVLLDEVQSQSRLVEELKAVMIGEKGRLPDSVVESVWDVYESIIPPNVPSDIARIITPIRETRFFEFIGLLAELDINLADIRAAANKLNQGISEVESLLASVEHMEDGNHIMNSNNNSNSNNSNRGGDITTTSSTTTTTSSADLSVKLVAAKHALMRQCFAVRHAGSPVHYLWLRQTASLERGMRRLMDLRRCISYFLNKSRHHILTIQAEQQKQKHKQEEEEKEKEKKEYYEKDDNDNNNNNTSLAIEKEMIKRQELMELWIARQRHLSTIDGALKFLFSDFFAKEWLVMEELTWDSTPPLLLEQVIAAEQVHPFNNGLSDMKKRIQPTHNRHLFAFFHPAVVEEPLIAVQVALTHGIANSVDRILGRPSPLNNNNNNNNKQEPHEGEVLCNDVIDTAIFYSINSAQSALHGINLGNLLIKRVVREIEAKLNTVRRANGLSPITTFSTLSPIPGYIHWLTAEVAKLQQCVRLQNTNGNNKDVCLKFTQQRIFGGDGKDDIRLFAQLRMALVGFAERHHNVYGSHFIAQLQQEPPDAISNSANLATMHMLLALFEGKVNNNTNNNKNAKDSLYKELEPWWEDHVFTRAIEAPLLRSVAHYLYEEKRRSRILDPVGNFHISNGATMFRLNYLANCTLAGSRESATVMVNYLYDPARVSEQVNTYEVHRTVSVGSNILQHLGYDEATGKKD